MIVREETDGSLLLIAQTDHARLSGTFAAHWGNAKFDRPRPFEPAVRAANFHDCGWYRYETKPRLNEDTGKTPNFMQVPLDREQLDAFQWAVDWLTDIDPYAGLLINRHRTGLWRARYGALRYPEAFNAKGLNEMAEKFISNNEQRQKSEMPGFDEKEFLTNYQLLQVWDLLSLYFCVRPVKEDYIDPVPTRYAEGPGSGVRMDVRPLDADACRDRSISVRRAAAFFQHCWPPFSDDDVSEPGGISRGLLQDRTRAHSVRSGAGDMMRAVRVHQYGGPEVLTIDTLPAPQPGAGQLAEVAEAHRLLESRSSVGKVILTVG